MAGDGKDSLTVEDLRAVCSSVGVRMTEEELQVTMSVATYSS